MFVIIILIFITIILLLTIIVRLPIVTNFPKYNYTKIVKQQVIERLKLNYGLHLDEQPSEQANNVGDEATDQTRYIYGR